ncbi:type ISP restriction/modification enzyme [Qipengyuania flava]|uniref:type ISP restriction/modification enzyme n=1 Tax=Qipengyuania flava TaxID=192812 RepID=UPI003BB03202
MTQASTIEKAVGDFGASAKAKLAGGDGQPEDQLRAPLETLFAEVAAILHPAVKNLVMTGETSLAEMRTRPDYAVKVNNALVGFIEVKAPGKGADPRKWKTGHDKEQWDKLKALPNLLYTDGDSFSLWRDGALIGQIIHLDGGVEHAGAKLAAPQTFLPLLNDFLTWKPIAPKGANELARVSARLCRFLRDEVLEQLNASEKNTKLTDLKDDWKALLFPDADDDKFADGYAQAVTFGLLMAKSKDMSLAGGLDHVAKELGKANTLIGTALRLLTEQDLNLGPALDTLTRVLDEVSWAKVSKGDPEAWLYFYENFLEVYDNKLRKLTGSYYTPPEVVRTMVRLCDEALKSPRFGIADGLAGKDVHIVDPATGSGTFLLGTIERIKATIEANHGGPGAVAPMMEDVAGRLIGFELQFGAFAVAQLRLLAEMLEIGADATPRLFVTDTLGDPYADIESGQGIYREISKSRTEANKIKRSEPITVVIGNPPYKEKAKGKGAWIESGSGNKAAPYKDWIPPKSYGRSATANAKHLRNLYIYFWRWATWKVFEQGAGGRDKEPPVEEKLAGMVCYITVAGFLNGPGFQKMRADLRRDCDDIWVIDCSPEGLLPSVPTRIFQGVKHPVCIVLALRTPANDPTKPAKVRYRALGKAHRDVKFAELGKVNLADADWSMCGNDWRDPFLPQHAGGWADFVAIDDVLGDTGLGVMPGRIWPIAPDRATLKTRWNKVISEQNANTRSELFHPHLSGGPSLDKGAKALTGYHPQIQSINGAIKDASDKDPAVASVAKAALELQGIQSYSVRSFDRQWIIADNRLINRENASLWNANGPCQVFLTALSQTSPKNGPGISLTSNIPDHDHYNGRGGRVFPLSKNAVGTESNVSPAVVALLAKAFGAPVDPVDVFAYVAALLAHPAYTASFADDLVRPGLRVPLTADAALFTEAATLGREVIRLHTFGERFATEDPPQPPRVAKDGPVIPKDGAIPSTPEGFPDTLDYDAAKRRLLVGTGFVDNVPPEVWAYEVSGKQVLRQWFSYRRKDRERPLIGDKRPPSPLGDIQPDHWLPEYTSELINVLNVLALLVELEPKQADLLKRICDGPLIPASKLPV